MGVPLYGPARVLVQPFHIGEVQGRPPRVPRFGPCRIETRGPVEGGGGRVGMEHDLIDAVIVVGPSVAWVSVRVELWESSGGLRARCPYIRKGGAAVTDAL